VTVSRNNGAQSARRLLVCCVNYAPEMLGSAPYTAGLAGWFRAHGWDVRVVTTYPYYPEWRRRPGDPTFGYRRETEGGVAVWRCPVWLPGSPGGARRLIHYASFAASSLPAMLAQAAWRPAVTLVVAPTLASSPAALLAARLSRGSAWLHVQDFELDVALRLGLLPKASARMLRGVQRRLLRSFDLVTTITPQMAVVAGQSGVEPGRLELLPNWAYLDQVRPLDRPSRFRDTLGLAGDRPVVVYTGSLGRKQGAGLIAAAAELAQRRGSRTLFVVAGEGAAKSELQRTVTSKRLPNVRLLPLQHGDDFNELLNLADAHLIVQAAGVADLVMPSKLSNALASGRPVVVTAADDTGLAQLVRDNDVGVVVPPGDPGALVSGIDSLLSSGAAARRQGDNARAFAEEHLDKDRLLAPLLERLSDGLRPSARDTLRSWPR